MEVRQAFYVTASTSSDGDDPACASFVNVFVTYRDVHGYTHSSGAGRWAVRDLGHG
jgi:hypothetical protein